MFPTQSPQDEHYHLENTWYTIIYRNNLMCSVTKFFYLQLPTLVNLTFSYFHFVISCDLLTDFSLFTVCQLFCSSNEREGDKERYQRRDVTSGNLRWLAPLGNVILNIFFWSPPEFCLRNVPRATSKSRELICDYERKVSILARTYSRLLRWLQTKTKEIPPSSAPAHGLVGKLTII